MHKPHLLFATKDKFTGKKSLIKAQYWFAFLSSHYGLSNSSFSKVLHIWLLKMKKGLRADTPHPHNNSTFFPLQLLHAKYTQQQHQEERFTHSATIWHLQNLSIHQMVHSLILHLLRLEGKIFLCYCSVQLLEPGKWNAWDLQTPACQQLSWRKYPDPRQFSRGCFLKQPHTIKLIRARHSNGPHKSPETNDLSVLARS